MDQNLESFKIAEKSSSAKKQQSIANILRLYSNGLMFLGLIFIVWLWLPMTISWGVPKFDSRGIQDFPTFALIHGISKSTLETDFWMWLYLRIFSNAWVWLGFVIVLNLVESFSSKYLAPNRSVQQISIRDLIDVIPTACNLFILFTEVNCVKFLASIQ